MNRRRTVVLTVTAVTAMVVVSVALILSFSIFSRVQNALAGLTGRGPSVVDTIGVLLPIPGTPSKLQPGSSRPEFPYVAVADLTYLREARGPELVGGLEEFRSATRVVEPDRIMADPDRINLLLLGMRGADDPRGGLLSDAIIVASIQQQTGRVAVISIPRDLYVEIPEIGGHYKINAAHAIGERVFNRGLDLAMATVSRIAGIPIHYGVRVEMSAFEVLIDTLGGIDVRVTRDFIGTPRERLSLQKGTVHMDGDTALRYASSRGTTDDFDRSRRQREVLRAIEDRLMAVRSPTELLDLLAVVGEHVRTTLAAHEIKQLLTMLATRNSEELIEGGFDSSPSGPLKSMRSEHGEYILVPRRGDFSDIHRMFREIFTSHVVGSN